MTHIPCVLKSDSWREVWKVQSRSRVFFNFFAALLENCKWGLLYLEGAHMLINLFMFEEKINYLQATSILVMISFVNRVDHKNFMPPQFVSSHNIQRNILSVLGWFDISDLLNLRIILSNYESSKCFLWFKWVKCSKTIVKNNLLTLVATILSACQISI